MFKAKKFHRRVHGLKIELGEKYSLDLPLKNTENFKKFVDPVTASSYTIRVKNCCHNMDFFGKTHNFT
jgi:hypothetical protein